MTEMRVFLRVPGYPDWVSAIVTYEQDADGEIRGMSMGDIRRISHNCGHSEMVGNAIAAAYRDGWEQRGWHERARASEENA